MRNNDDEMVLSEKLEIDDTIAVLEDKVQKKLVNLKEGKEGYVNFIYLTTK